MGPPAGGKRSAHGRLPGNERAAARQGERAHRGDARGRPAARIHIDFRCTSGDRILLTGKLAVADSATSGKTVVVDVGGVSRTFVLDARGRGTSGDDTFQFTGNLKGGLRPFQVKTKKDDLSDALADEGLTGAADVRKADRTMSVLVSYDGSIQRTVVTLSYTAKAQRTGDAKLKR